MLFSYIGPETMMPVASAIAAAAGVFMMFGRNIVGFGRGLVRKVMPGSGWTPPPPTSTATATATAPTAAPDPEPAENRTDV